MKSMILVFLVFLSISCGLVRTPTSSDTEPPNDQSQVETGRTMTDNEIDDRKYPELNRLAVEYELVPLEEKMIKDRDFEMRLWSSVDLGLDKCIVLARTDGLWKVSMITPLLNDGEEVLDATGKPKTQIHILADSEPGQERLNAFVEANGLYPPMRFALDPPSDIAIIDEGVIAVETKSARKYDVVSYRSFSQTGDGKSIKQVCKQLEEWYGVSIGCGH